MKITESQLRQIIREALSEYRSDRDFDNDGFDGDRRYVRPNGKTNVGTGLDSLQYHSGKRGKVNQNSDSPLFSHKTFTHDTSNTAFSHGKGFICSKALDMLRNILYGDNKIEWTDAEKETIEKACKIIRHLACLTKIEGNKKRGYMPDAAEE